MINIYGAGLSGLTASIILSREGYDVTVFEKEERVGLLGNYSPSVQMTPIDFKKMKEYIGIDVEGCFSKLHSFNAYIYSKIVCFDPRYLYVTERGSNKTSIDYFLFKIAQREGVSFEFSNPLTPDMISSIPDNSIIATGTYSGLSKCLKLGGIPFVHFDGHIKTQFDENFCLAFFDSYISGYGYAYVASKEGLVSGEVDFFLNQDYKKYLKIFKKRLLKSMNLEFGEWILVEDYIPVKFNLIKRWYRKNLVLAGAISGFHDPFFGFGVNSALISGKIAALTIISKKKGLEEFNRVTKVLARMFLFSRIYRHLPFKNIIVPCLLKSSTTSIPIVGNDFRSIPGFTHSNCFKILNVKW
jgi:hypothetical protein